MRQVNGQKTRINAQYRGICGVCREPEEAGAHSFDHAFAPADDYEQMIGTMVEARRNRHKRKPPTPQTGEKP